MKSSLIRLSCTYMAQNWTYGRRLLIWNTFLFSHLKSVTHFKQQYAVFPFQNLVFRNVLLRFSGLNSLENGTFVRDTLLGGARSGMLPIINISSFSPGYEMLAYLAHSSH